MSNPAISYVHGGCVEPLRYATIGESLEAAARRWPKHVALIARHQGVRWNYAALNAAADELASGLLALGLVALRNAFQSSTLNFTVSTFILEAVPTVLSLHWYLGM